MRAALAAVGLAGALLLTSCSSNGPPSADARAPTGSTTPSSPGAAPNSPGTAGAPDRGTVAGSKLVQGKDAHQLLVELRGLHRDGKLLRLDYTVTNTSSARLFAPDVLPGLLASDVNLLDTQALKKYLVVKDNAGQYAFTRASQNLVPQAVFDGTAYFAAPPSDVSSLTVNFAELGAFPTPVT